MFHNFTMTNNEFYFHCCFALLLLFSSIEYNHFSFEAFISLSWLMLFEAAVKKTSRQCFCLEWYIFCLYSVIKGSMKSSNRSTVRSFKSIQKVSEREREVKREFRSYSFNIYFSNSLTRVNLNLFYHHRQHFIWKFKSNWISWHISLKCCWLQIFFDFMSKKHCSFNHKFFKRKMILSCNENNAVCYKSRMMGIEIAFFSSNNNFCKYMIDSCWKMWLQIHFIYVY